MREVEKISAHAPSFHLKGRKETLPEKEEDKKKKTKRRIPSKAGPPKQTAGSKISATCRR